jgi:hypothetical protein
MDSNVSGENGAGKENVQVLLDEVVRLRAACVAGRDPGLIAERVALIRQEISLLERVSLIKPAYKRDLAMALRRLAADLRVDRQPYAARTASCEAEVLLRDLALANRPAYGKAWASALIELVLISSPLSWDKRLEVIKYCFAASLQLRDLRDRTSEFLRAERDLLRAIRAEVSGTTLPVSTEELDRRIRAIRFRIMRMSILRAIRYLP